MKEEIYYIEPLNGFKVDDYIKRRLFQDMIMVSAPLVLLPTEYGGKMVGAIQLSSILSDYIGEYIDGKIGKTSNFFLKNFKYLPSVPVSFAVASILFPSDKQFCKKMLLTNLVTAISMIIADVITD
jgi:hypothetical protein